MEKESFLASIVGVGCSLQLDSDHPDQQKTRKTMSAYRTLALIHSVMRDRAMQCHSWASPCVQSRIQKSNILGQSVHLLKKHP